MADGNFNVVLHRSPLYIKPVVVVTIIVTALFFLPSCHSSELRDSSAPALQKSDASAPPDTWQQRRLPVALLADGNFNVVLHRSPLYIKPVVVVTIIVTALFFLPSCHSSELRDSSAPALQKSDALPVALLADGNFNVVLHRSPLYIKPVVVVTIIVTALFFLPSCHSSELRDSSAPALQKSDASAPPDTWQQRRLPVALLADGNFNVVLHRSPLYIKPVVVVTIIVTALFFLPSCHSSELRDSSAPALQKSDASAPPDTWQQRRLPVALLADGNFNVVLHRSPLYIKPVVVVTIIVTALFFLPSCHSSELRDSSAPALQKSDASAPPDTWQQRRLPVALLADGNFNVVLHRSPLYIKPVVVVTIIVTALFFLPSCHSSELRDSSAPALQKSDASAPPDTWQQRRLPVALLADGNFNVVLHRSPLYIKPVVVVTIIVTALFFLPSCHSSELRDSSAPALQKSDASAPPDTWQQRRLPVALLADGNFNVVLHRSPLYIKPVVVVTIIVTALFFLPSCHSSELRDSSAPALQKSDALPVALLADGNFNVVLHRSPLYIKPVVVVTIIVTALFFLPSCHSSELRDSSAPALQKSDALPVALLADGNFNVVLHRSPLYIKPVVVVTIIVTALFFLPSCHSSELRDSSAPALQKSDALPVALLADGNFNVVLHRSPLYIKPVVVVTIIVTALFFLPSCHSSELRDSSAPALQKSDALPVALLADGNFNVVLHRSPLYIKPVVVVTIIVTALFFLPSCHSSELRDSSAPALQKSDALPVALLADGNFNVVLHRSPLYIKPVVVVTIIVTALFFLPSCHSSELRDSSAPALQKSDALPVALLADGNFNVVLHRSPLYIKPVVVVTIIVTALFFLPSCHSSELRDSSAPALQKSDASAPPDTWQQRRLPVALLADGNFNVVLHRSPLYIKPVVVVTIIVTALFFLPSCHSSELRDSSAPALQKSDASAPPDTWQQRRLPVALLADGNFNVVLHRSPLYIKPVVVVTIIVTALFFLPSCHSSELRDSSAPALQKSDASAPPDTWQQRRLPVALLADGNFNVVLHRSPLYIKPVVVVTIIVTALFFLPSCHSSELRDSSAPALQKSDASAPPDTWQQRRLPVALLADGNFNVVLHRSPLYIKPVVVVTIIVTALFFLPSCHSSELRDSSAPALQKSDASAPPDTWQQRRLPVALLADGNFNVVLHRSPLYIKPVVVVTIIVTALFFLPSCHSSELRDSSAPALQKSDASAPPDTWQQRRLPVALLADGNFNVVLHRSPLYIKPVVVVTIIVTALFFLPSCHSSELRDSSAPALQKSDASAPPDTWQQRRLPVALLADGNFNVVLHRSPLYIKPVVVVTIIVTALFFLPSCHSSELRDSSAPALQKSDASAPPDTWQQRRLPVALLADGNFNVVLHRSPLYIKPVVVVTIIVTALFFLPSCHSSELRDSSAPALQKSDASAPPDTWQQRRLPVALLADGNFNVVLHRSPLYIKPVVVVTIIVTALFFLPSCHSSELRDSSAPALQKSDASAPPDTWQQRRLPVALLADGNFNVVLHRSPLYIKPVVVVTIIVTALFFLPSCHSSELRDSSAPALQKSDASAPPDTWQQRRLPVALLADGNFNVVLHRSPLYIKPVVVVTIIVTALFFLPSCHSSELRDSSAPALQKSDASAPPDTWQQRRLPVALLADGNFNVVLHRSPLYIKPVVVVTIIVTALFFLPSCHSSELRDSSAPALQKSDASAPPDTWQQRRLPVALLADGNFNVVLHRSPLYIKPVVVVTIIVTALFFLPSCHSSELRDSSAPALQKSDASAPPDTWQQRRLPVALLADGNFNVVLHRSPLYIKPVVVVTIIVTALFFLPSCHSSELRDSSAPALQKSDALPVALLADGNFNVVLHRSPLYIKPVVVVTIIVTALFFLPSCHSSELRDSSAPALQKSDALPVALLADGNFNVVLHRSPLYIKPVVVVTIIVTALFFLPSCHSSELRDSSAPALQKSDALPVALLADGNFNVVLHRSPLYIKPVVVVTIIVTALFFLPSCHSSELRDSSAPALQKSDALPVALLADGNFNVVLHRSPLYIKPVVVVTIIVTALFFLPSCHSSELRDSSAPALQKSDALPVALLADGNFNVVLHRSPLYIKPVVVVTIIVTALFFLPSCHSSELRDSSAPALQKSDALPVALLADGNFNVVLHRSPLYIKPVVVVTIIVTALFFLPSCHSSELRDSSAPALQKSDALPVALLADGNFNVVLHRSPLYIKPVVVVTIIVTALFFLPSCHSSELRDSSAPALQKSDASAPPDTWQQRRLPVALLADGNFNVVLHRSPLYIKPVVVVTIIVTALFFLPSCHSSELRDSSAPALQKSDALPVALLADGNFNVVLHRSPLYIKPVVVVTIIVTALFFLPSCHSSELRDSSAPALQKSDALPVALLADGNFNVVLHRSPLYIKPVVVVTIIVTALFFLPSCHSSELRDSSAPALQKSDALPVALLADGNFNVVLHRSPLYIKPVVVVTIIVTALFFLPSCHSSELRDSSAPALQKSDALPVALLADGNFNVVLHRSPLYIKPVVVVTIIVTALFFLPSCHSSELRDSSAPALQKSDALPVALLADGNFNVVLHRSPLYIKPVVVVTIIVTALFFLPSCHSSELRDSSAPALQKSDASAPPDTWQQRRY
ncbi:hypothetical protein ISCGN_005432 [Ixodes scapularis]